MEKNGEIQASVEITNVGKLAGREVAQLYIRDKYGSVTRPVRELKGFQAVFLQPSESTTVTFKIKENDIAFYGSKMELAPEEGDFILWIGPHSASSSSVDFRYEEI